MKFSTRNEAVQVEILDAIESTGVVADATVEFDIDAIADATLGGYADGFATQVDAAEFWAIVEANALVTAAA